MLSAQARKNAIEAQSQAKNCAAFARDSLWCYFEFPNAREADKRYWLREAAKEQQFAAEQYIVQRYVRDYDDA